MEHTLLSFDEEINVEMHQPPQLSYYEIQKELFVNKIKIQILEEKMDRLLERNVSQLVSVLVERLSEKDTLFAEQSAIILKQEREIIELHQQIDVCDSTHLTYRISDELAVFLDKRIGTNMTRMAVTRDINNYIRYNNLQDKQNGRKINPDKKLSTILKNKDNDVTFFNLQRYLNHHFVYQVQHAPAAPPVDL